MGKYFGTDGFRGEANVTLTVEDAYKVGRFLGWYYGQKTKADRCRVVIGKDTRRSSYMFEYSLVSGLTASGADVYLLHVTTTPSVSYVVRTEEFDCGIMISASHNPYYDNGIKVINGRGEKLEEETIEKIESYLDGEMGEIPFAKRDAIGRTVDYAAGRNRYIGYLISLATRSFKNMRVGLDCANGSASAIAKNVFDALGAETHVINNTPDGLNINYQCGALHPEAMQARVREVRADIGLALDGDADRLIVADEKGRILDGDQIMALCADDMMRHGTLHDNVLVGTVMSNMALEVFMEERGGRLERTRVGDRYVGEAMRRLDATLGGEQSGHLIFRNYSTTGDGLLAALQVLRIMRERKRPLSELADLLQLYPQRLISVPVQRKPPLEECSEIQEVVRAAEAELAEPEKRGRVLLRYSGTENVCRVMVESVREDVVQRLAREIADIVRRVLG